MLRASNRLPISAWSRRWRVWLCAAAALLCTLSARVAWAQCNTTDLNDCDGDGTPNLQDPCPASAGTTTPDASIRHGFRDVACYERVVTPLAQNSGCIPVAVRPFERDVPVDPTDPSSKIDHRVGFTWVGVLDTSQAIGADTKMNQLIADAASPTQVENSLRDTSPSAEPVPNALFACIQSVEIHDVTGSTVGKPAFQPYPAVEGFRIATSYARAIVEAANTAASIGYPAGDPTTFQDALGLITDPCAAAGGGTCWLRGLVGTNGALEDDGTDWSVSTPTAIFDQVPDDDLPTDINKVYDADCMRKKILQTIVNALLQTKPAGAPGPPQPDPIAEFEGMTTPFGLPAFGMTGAGMSSQPLGLVEGEYEVPAAIPSMDAGDLYAPVGSDCSVSTNGPNFMFPVSQDYNYPTVDQASTHRHLSGWKDFMGGRGAPRPYAPGVTAFYAAHAHKANPEVDPDFSFDLLEPRPPTPPPFRDAISTSALLLSQVSTATQPPYVAVETGHALWGVLDQLNWSDHVTPLAAPWLRVSSGGQRTLGIYHLAAYIDSQTYDYAHDKWTQSYTEYGGQGDYAEVTAPTAWFSGDGENVDKARVSVHVTGDKWHPADDQWLTNGKKTGCSALVDELPWFPMNPNFGDVNDFCQDYPAIQNIQQLQDDAKRIEFCNVKHYDPGTPELHWRPLKDRTAFAALWGRLPTHGRTTAHFPPSDLVRAGISRTAKLHQSSDINWVFDQDDIETTDLIPSYGNKVCWSQLVALGHKVQMADSCSDPGYAVCGSKAEYPNCCNPIDQAAQKFKNQLKKACSCSSSDCSKYWQWACDIKDGFVCAAKELAECTFAFFAGAEEFVFSTAADYANLLCVPVTGKPCFGSAGYSLCSGPPDSTSTEMENELEYNLAYGALVNKTGRGAGSGYPQDCNASSPGPSACSFPDDYTPGNWLYSDQAPYRVSLDKKMNITGTDNDYLVNKTAGLIEQTAPLTLGPGIFQKPYGAWAYMATTSGNNPGIKFPRILVPSQDIHNIGLKILQAPKPQPYAFRIEMLGDLIIDCGHEPFRSEIHPPVAIALHLAGTPRARYSLWGWHRSSDNDPKLRDPIDVELWPDLPRPSSTAQIKMHIVFNGGIGSGAGNWDCSPSPPDVPTHMHCRLVADTSDAQGDCNDNPRMRSDCASDVAGGLVEVYWQ